MESSASARISLLGATSNRRLFLPPPGVPGRRRCSLSWTLPQPPALTWVLKYFNESAKYAKFK